MPSARECGRASMKRRARSMLVSVMPPIIPRRRRCARGMGASPRIGRTPRKPQVTQRHVYLNVKQRAILPTSQMSPAMTATTTTPSKDALLTIREMCDAYDVTPRTLRFYEAKELLFPQRRGTARFFTYRDRARLKLILRGKRFGFSLEDIRQLLEMYDRDPGQQEAQLARTIELAKDRLAQMERQRTELDEAIAELKEQMDWGANAHAALDPAFTEAVLTEAGRLATDVLAPLNASGDREGCHFENGAVRTPKGFPEAYRQIREGGWIALDCDPAYGGQGLPYIMGTAVGEIFVAANMALNMYQGLTHGAYSAIHSHGSDDQKTTYLPRIVSGDWA